jgi:hypothetical protein
VIVSNNRTTEIKTGRTVGMTGSYNWNSFPQLIAVQFSIPIIQQGKNAERKNVENKNEYVHSLFEET